MPFMRYMPSLMAYAAATAGSAGLLVHSSSFAMRDNGDDQPDLAEPVPSRTQQLSRLRNSTIDKPFDLLIIGGGATGTGCALDAATRGLKCALVEREDFGSGTSSRSTKLVHGGVRYLEKAVFNADYGQLKLVFEALRERSNFFHVAPHLTAALPILMPCYKWWEIPFYWAGLKAYDFLAMTRSLVWSKYLSAAESVARLPTLTETRSDGSSLKGTVLYYDGQFDDARMNVALACTAAAAGATVANYLECTNLIKNEEGQVVGARCRDSLTGEQLEVFARVTLNATGPFTDQVRRLGEPEAAAAIMPSAGAHIVLPDFFGSTSIGMIVPKTKDGRVVFMLPWQGHIVAGTTDSACPVTSRPSASSSEVDFILETLQPYLNVKLRRSDVLSTWSGVRPLALDPSASSTEGASRDHVIWADKDGLLNVAGGKWTTYRLMAEQAVDAALNTGRLPASRPCSTATTRLLGAAGYHPTLFAEVAQAYNTSAGRRAMDSATARHLAGAYGDRALSVLRVAEERGLSRRLAGDAHPVMEAEVVYAVRHEYCTTVEDFLARRTRLAFVDTAAAVQAVPRVAELMAGELGWSAARRREEVDRALAFLKTFAPAGAAA